MRIRGESPRCEAKGVASRWMGGFGIRMAHGVPIGMRFQEQEELEQMVEVRRMRLNVCTRAGV